MNNCFPVGTARGTYPEVIMDESGIASFDSLNGFGYQPGHTMLYSAILMLILSTLLLAATTDVCTAASPQDAQKSTAPAVPTDAAQQPAPTLSDQENTERIGLHGEDLAPQNAVSEPGANPAMSGESTGVPVATEGKWLRVSNMNSIYFAYGSTQLTESAMEWIRRHAERLRANRRLTVTLYGYTDDYSSSSYSVALGTSRANIVRNQLIALDVAPSQIRVTSYGQDESTAPCLTDVCRTSYRRVEFRYAEIKNP